MMDISKIENWKDLHLTARLLVTEEEMQLGMFTEKQLKDVLLSCNNAVDDVSISLRSLAFVVAGMGVSGNSSRFLRCSLRYSSAP
jgi:hypothetical protein